MSQRFHPLVRRWFDGRFEAPTDAQEAGWPAIAEGRHTLIAAPTGSGKTLAAFMTCIDRLVRAGLDGGLPERTEVVYVSPLKALSNDIRRNLDEPLSEIMALAEAEGTPLEEIRAAVRTGDTPAKERQAMAKKPPHILITTPESLYILLTSKSGRAALEGVRTLILDELHAVAGNKRGSHLSISVERLCELADGPVTRIGLSATQRPVDEVARFLVGCDNIDANGDAECTIVDTGHRREMDLQLRLPEDELGPIATHDVWDQTLDAVAKLVKEHETTLVFVNTRRLVERVTRQMSDRLGEDAVVPHHGSLSKERRHDAEQRLKSGQVSLCVATSSLELGIDIGSVDLVCQIGSPRSIGLMLQRVGRSGHQVGGTPKGRLFPLTRDELIECMAMVRGFKGGNLDRLLIPDWPLDVLAQQIVAECGAREWGEDALYQLVRRAYPYRDLPLDRYEQVLETLARGVAPRQGRRSAYVHRDGVNRRLRGRRSARLAAMTSGGAIPDNADYDVIAEPDNTFVGTVNEDFAIESARGDVFLLGNTPWRIRRVESGRVRVEDAQGSSPTVPFWLGEAPGRTTELSDEVSELRAGIHSRVDPEDGARWLVEQGFPQDAAEQAAAYVEEGVRILGAVPTKERIVAERFFDDSGGMQLVIHSPFGSRINRAWGMSLRKEICRAFDFELQAAATEDGINLSLGPSQSFPLEDVFKYIRPDKVEKVLTQAILQAPIFGVRWRWDASRALAVLRFSSGKKVPAPLQRMRSEDLLAAVFPEQVACQDNAMPGDIEVPDHPIVFETMRDCTTEAMDMEGLKALLESIRAGDVEVYARDTTQPSVFSHQILNAMPYAFLDDAPLEERRSRAVALRRALPEDSRDLGKLDDGAIRAAAADAWPLVRDADELHDALLTLGLLPEAELARGAAPPSVEQAREWFAALVADGRAVTATYADGHAAWVAVESVPTVLAVFPDARLVPTPQGRLDPASVPTEDDAIFEIVRGWVESIGPFTPADLADTIGMRKSSVDIALARMEAGGGIIRGHFTPDIEEEEACDRRILARIHRATVTRLRKAVEPVSSAVYGRFLFRWQHASGQRRGDAALLDVVEQLQGFESAAGAWESEILPLRIADYDPTALDVACLSGDVVWGRFNGRPVNGEGQASRAVLSRSIPISLGLREALPWLIGPPGGDAPPGAASDVLDYLALRGATFLPEIASATRRMPSEVETALWQLAAAGLVTSDGFGAVRGLVDGARKRARGTHRRRSRGRLWRPASRWALLDPDGAAAAESEDDRPRSLPDDVLEARATQILRRYGVVFPEVLARDALAPRWRDLVRVYRRAEARGEIRGGRFVTGYVGEQFAMPEAVDRLRSVRKQEPDGGLVVVSACDPLNLAGVLTPGPRVPAVLGNRVVYRDGVPVASLESGDLRFHADLADADRSRVAEKLGARPAGSARVREPAAIGR